MSAKKGNQMILTESPSISDVTLAEYNRWVVEREHKAIAEERRADMERERQVRAKMEEEWRARGLARFTANKDQMQVTKREVEAFRKSNLERGNDVKNTAQLWKQQRKDETDRWLEKSQQVNKDFGTDLKVKIADQKKSLTERNRQCFLDVKAELKAYQEIRDDRHQTFMASQKDRRNQIRELTQSSNKERDAKDEKGFAYEKKKTGEQTRAQVKEWRERKTAMQEAHAQRAIKQKQDIAASKSAAKSARDELQKQRRNEAIEVRNHKVKVASEYADQSKEQEKMNRIKHNDIRIGRFVPPEMARAVKEDTTFTDAIRYANTHHSGSGSPS